MVEDDRATVKALRALFDRRGWEVLTASTIAEAVPLLSALPDCLILDLMLPDGDGAAILERIKASDLPIRVAVTTGSHDAARLKAVSELRPAVLLAKPINLRDLLEGLGIAP